MRLRELEPPLKFPKKSRGKGLRLPALLQAFEEQPLRRTHEPREGKSFSSAWPRAQTRIAGTPLMDESGHLLARDNQNLRFVTSG